MLQFRDPAGDSDDDDDTLLGLNTNTRAVGYAGSGKMLEFSLMEEKLDGASRAESDEARTKKNQCLLILAFIVSVRSRFSLQLPFPSFYDHPPTTDLGHPCHFYATYCGGENLCGAHGRIFGVCEQS
jgi:hypothetical protein